MKFRPALCLLAFLAAPVCAQQARLDERLPATTSFYVYWRGAASYATVQNTNPLLRLWNDPEFAPARAALLDDLMRGDGKTPVPAALTRDALLALLENPFVFGTVSTGKPAESKQVAPGPGEKPPAPDNSYLIYDATDKKTLVEKMLQSEFAGADKPPAITRTTFGKTTIETVAGPKETYYRAYVGNYFLRAGQKEILEDLIGRLGADSRPATSLSQAAEFQEVRRLIGEHASLEFMLRITDLTTGNLPPTAGFSADAVMKPLRVEKLRAVCGGLTFAAETTRAQMAVLGDTSPGGLLDVVGESVPNFVILAAAPPGMTSFTAFQFDLPAIYRLVKTTVNALVPSQQGNSADALEGMAAMSLGMSVSDAVELFTGEFATFSADLGTDPFSNSYATGIRKPEKVLQLLRVILSKQIQSEDTEGENTYLSLTTSFNDPKTGTPVKRFYYLGVTPHTLLVGPRKEELRETARRLASPATTNENGLAADTKFTAARMRIPQSLGGLSYSDLSRIHWETALEAAGQKAADAPNAGTAASSASPNWSKLLKPALLTRYLHLTISGWWKGPDGLHFDGILE